jgi:hypothetical protein
MWFDVRAKSNERTSDVFLSIELFVLTMKPAHIIYYAISLIRVPLVPTRQSRNLRARIACNSLATQTQTCFKFRKLICHWNRWNCRKIINAFRYNDTDLLTYHEINGEVKCFIRVISIVIFWVETPCSRLGGYQRFGGTYRLHLAFYIKIQYIYFN